MNPATQITASQFQFLQDVMCSAIEGGIGYWAAVRNVKQAKDYAYIEFDVRDMESKDEWKHIDAVTLDAAVRKIMHGEVKVGRDYAAQFIGYPNNADGGAVDAVGADIAVQIATYGEIIFG